MILPTSKSLTSDTSHASRDNIRRLTRLPSYASFSHVNQTSPTTPRQQMSARNTTPSNSSASAVSAHTSSGDRAPSDDRDAASASGSSIASTGIQEPRYIYYQVYSEGEAIHAKTSFTEEDPFIGRIVSQRVAPPHTAASIKRFLSKQENISDHNCTNLYATIFSHSALEDGCYASVETGDGPGSSPQQPMALVISDPPKKTKKEVEKIEAGERKKKKEAEAKEKKRRKEADKVDAEGRKRKERGGG